MELGIIVIVVAVVVVGAFVSGYVNGRTDSPPTINPPAPASGADCQQACARWDNARQMQCNAKAAEALALSRAAAIQGQLVATLAAAIPLLGAGLGALAALGPLASTSFTIFTIPLTVLLAGIGVALLVVGTALLATAAFFAGQLVAAQADAAAKAATRAAWDTEVTNARAEVNMKCSPTEANACLSRTAPC